MNRSTAWWICSTCTPSRNVMDAACFAMMDLSLGGCGAIHFAPITAVWQEAGPLSGPGHGSMEVRAAPSERVAVGDRVGRSGVVDTQDKRQERRSVPFPAALADELWDAGRFGCRSCACATASRLAAAYPNVAVSGGALLVGPSRIGQIVSRLYRTPTRLDTLEQRTTNDCNHCGPYELASVNAVLYIKSGKLLTIRYHAGLQRISGVYQVPMIGPHPYHAPAQSYSTRPGHDLDKSLDSPDASPFGGL
jgi:hypothetical protein